MQTNKLKKNKFSQGLKLVALFAMVLSVVCCSKKNVDERVNVPESAKNFVSADDAKSLLSEVGALTKSGDNSKFAEIETVTQVGDAEGNAVFYAVNYQGGGFILLSADNRMEPVLAFSDTNTFSVEAIPETGVSIWAAMTADQISEIRRENLPQSIECVEMWKPINIVRSLDVDTEDKPAPPDDCPIGSETITVNPLMATIWDQGSGFNNQVPLMCGGDRAPVGCVPVAMGQIMKYYHYPYAYNWNGIPNSTGGAETSKLLYDIGYNSGIRYDCNGSSVELNNIVPTFYAFGYKSVYSSNYDYNIAMSELDKGQPVILSGGTRGGGLWNPTFKNGHAWVCDGYQESSWCREYQPEPNDPQGEVSHQRNSSVKLYMKWGWGGRSDGWFMSDNFNPSESEHTYNYSTKIYYNIIPQ